TWGQVNGVGRELFKDPITDSGVKKSAKGLLRIEESENGFTLFAERVNSVTSAPRALASLIAMCPKPPKPTTATLLPFPTFQ
ncbi:hypothetical protein, partial [Acinetobacter baumannii]|uniref:hypothetical protein n=1 Tax=Acinetobacter baumannii TaxID=470 RepID=UPI001CB7CBE7